MIVAIYLPTKYFINQSLVFILAALLIGVYANAFRIIHSNDR